MGLFDERRNYNNSSNTESNDDIYDATKRNRTSSIVVFVIIILAYLIYTTVGGSANCSGETTTGRVKLDGAKCNLLNRWYEEEGEYTDSTVRDEMITFYESTGVEPFLLIVDDSEKHTVDELAEIAEEYYKDELFSADTSQYDEGHFVIAFQPQGDSYAVGYYLGSDARTVLDDAALGTFGTSLSDSFNKYTGTEIFSTTFKASASAIMGKSKASIYIIIALVVICVLYFAYNMYRTNKQRQQKSQN